MEVEPPKIMRIAINAADLDHSKIDGTRIYIQNLLKNFGLQDKEDRFLIYHKKNFNPQLEFPSFENYEIIKKPFPFWWTQTRFAWEMLKKKPEVIFMPMHSLPFLRSNKSRTVVTIHDLAFKFFPDHFPKKDLRRLNFFTDYAVTHSDKIIAISKSTKKDILKYYPSIKGDKIKVIYHGYNDKLYNDHISPEEIRRVKKKYNIKSEQYIIHVGVVRPRKNIETLLKAFCGIKNLPKYKSLGLVLAGRLDYDEIRSDIEKVKDITVTGMYKTEDLPALIRGANALVFPSLYEGFGLPIVEAMACGTPVAAADNSSLSEVAGNAGLLFDPYSSEKIAQALMEILKNDKLRNTLREKGFQRARDFSWEKCTRDTLAWLKN